ncbi:U11/U12 small nuclear ribonucleoprotein 48 kDa protein [Synchiropus splendidus]|uniref:U11/U12 small nuclear ribonucleoprotein 48 kDa protein n=1 Tax=Synchiropus splendidus TaxID=270530 RepID=UPI00237E13AF|nr:U11/U12 small nuclear ribonucleoprotein 48 kDa protein [Synchiropus splendidus]
MDATVVTETVQERAERLRELTDFTEKCQKQLRDIYKLLNWSPELTNQKQQEMVTCPFDSGHRVPLQTLERHKHSCSLRKMGYTPEEQAEMCDSSVCYENKAAVRSFIMDDVTQQQVIQKARAAAPLMKMEGVFWQGQFSSGHIHVPQNHKRAICDLTVADRLALYDHVTQSLNSQKDPSQSGSEDLYVDLVKKLQKDEEQTEPKSQLELMAEMRDYKRRRQSYRAKNVHITKKSYTEVIREVIAVHSAELARQWSQEEEEGGAASDVCLRDKRHERRHGERRRERSSSSESGHSRERSDVEHRERKRRKSDEKKKKKKKAAKKKKRKED